MSLSARRAWIEIRRPRPKTLTKNVALRKESVDRNNSPGGDAYAGVVALRKESVDRNLAPCRGRPQGVPSLSARRAWIEILRAVLRERCQPGVALRKESVDRNRRHEDGSLRLDVALRKESVDRNSWAARARVAQYVALRKESVDRNTLSAISAAVVALSLSARRAWIEIAATSRKPFCSRRRSPQGERG